MKNTTPSPIRSVVRFYDAHHQAEDAIIMLQENGFDMTLFSIIAVDLYTSEKVLGYYNAGDKIKAWATSGGFWTGFWGLLFGFSTYSIPIIGPLLLKTWIGAIITGLAFGIVGALSGAIAAIIYSLFIPKHNKIKYKTAVKAGRYMLLAQADERQMKEIVKILHLRTPKEKHEAVDWRPANPSEAK